MTAPFVILLWGSNKNPVLSTKGSGREMLEGMQHWDFLGSREAALGILCSGCWTSEQDLTSFFGREGNERILVIEDLPKRKPTGWQSLLIPLKPWPPGSAWLHLNVFLMCLSITAVDISLQRNRARRCTSWVGRVICVPWNSASFEEANILRQRYFWVEPFHFAHLPSFPDCHV